MAIYSFNHDSFGRTNKRAGAAAQNAAYNARESETLLPGIVSELGAAENAAYNARAEATYAVRSHIIPPGPEAAEAWFRQKELGARKNARMSDRFIGALPRELTPEQCIGAVEAFCREVTRDRVPWHFALHLELEKKGDKDWNPHAHIIFHDRDIETGRRYLFTSAGPKERRQLDAKGVRYWTTEHFREMWSATLNHALERAGHDERVDHRSLDEQGIDRTPQIHVGPGAQKAGDKEHAFRSQDHMIGDRVVLYSEIDRGTRQQHNQRIIAGNDNRVETAWTALIAAGQPKTREEQQRRELASRQAGERRLHHRDQQQDRAALRQLHAAGLIKHRAWSKELHKGARAEAYGELMQVAKLQWQKVRAVKNKAARKEAEVNLRVELKQTYKLIKTRKIEALQPAKDAAWKALAAAQQTERDALRAQHQDESKVFARQQVAERLAVMERTRAAELQRQTNVAGARFGKGQGMVNQQTAARAMAKISHKAVETKDAARVIQIPVNPLEAARHYDRQANEAAQEKVKLRLELNGQRQQRTMQAAEQVAQPRRTRAGRAVDALAQVTIVANIGLERARKRRRDSDANKGKGQSFTSRFAERRAAPAYPSAARSATKVVRNDEQQRASRQQTARNGRPMTEADKLNLSPDARGTLPTRGRREQQKSDRELLRDVMQQMRKTGRDRGGGRGR